MEVKNFIHPTSFVDKDVKLGTNNHIGPFCYLTGDLTIGDNNRFEAYCSVGTRPEHTEHWHKDGKIIIGNNCTFREHITITSGTTTPTLLEDNIIVLSGSYIGHDCIIERDVIISCNSTILGHVHVMKESNCGAGCLIHQYQIIGSWSMIGMGCVIPKKSSIKPGGVWVGTPAKYLRENTYKTQNINKNEYKNEFIRWADIVGHHIPTKKI